MPWWMILLECVVLVALASVAYAASRGAPWVPTWRNDAQQIAAFVALKPGELFYELGSGDGRVCTMVSDAVPEARVIGVELGIPQWLVAQMRRVRRWNRPLSFKLANYFSISLQDADVVYLFLMPEPYAKLKPKLEAELKPGARVVTYVWPMEGWEPTRVYKDGVSKMYLYTR